MSTNKIVVRTTEEFMTGYKPKYKPLYTLLLGNAQAYSEDVGTHTWRRLEAVGDLRAKHLTPKDTEIRQIAVKDGTKSFKKYFLANQYVQSKLQKEEDIDGIVQQVLDEHQKQFDEIASMGEGTAANDVINNGLYWSADPNYELENSVELHNSPDTEKEFYNLLMGNLEDARKLEGNRAIVVYGATALAKLNSLIPDQVVSLRSLLTEGIEGDGRIVRAPLNVVPSGANGWMIVNLDNVKFHYVALPKLDGQGVNDEKKYSWHNFLMGSSMVEVQADEAIIRQPVTFEA